MLDSQKLGLQGTIDELRKLLVSKFRVAQDPQSIQAEEPLFSAGVGLSSIDGIELIVELEKQFGVEFQDMERWVDESPSITTVAQYLIDESKKHASPKSAM